MWGVFDADDKELARGSVTSHSGTMSWTVTRNFEADFEELLGEGWMDRRRSTELLSPARNPGGWPSRMDRACHRTGRRPRPGLSLISKKRSAISLSCGPMLTSTCPTTWRYRTLSSTGLTTCHLMR